MFLNMIENRGGSFILPKDLFLLNIAFVNLSFSWWLFIMLLMDKNMDQIRSGYCETIGFNFLFNYQV